MNDIYHSVSWRSHTGQHHYSDGGPYSTHTKAVEAYHRIREQVEANGGKCLGWITRTGAPHNPPVDELREGRL
jgi:hypothetical protein